MDLKILNVIYINFLSVLYLFEREREREREREKYIFLYILKV